VKPCASALAVIFAVLTAGPALADPCRGSETAGRTCSDEDADLARLRILFADGQALEAAGRWADALERFDAVARWRSTPEIQFHRAICLERLGRLLAADHAFKSARASARQGDGSVRAEADAHIADLDARIPRVRVALSGVVRDVVLKLDGRPVSAEAVERVDPGPHVLLAVRSGRVVAAVAFSASERRAKVVTLVVHPERTAHPEVNVARSRPIRRATASR
jgi:hypothetical protein